GATGCLGLHLPEHGIHHFYLSAGSVTGRADFGSCAGSSFQFFNFNGFLSSVYHFCQIQLDSYSQVGSSSLLSSSGIAEAAETAATEVATKDISELRENIFHAHSATETAATAKSSAAAHSCMPELVVTCVFVAVAQYFVGFSCFFEIFFSLLVIRIFIRMVLQSHFSVGFFYFVGSSVFVYAQYLIVVFFRHNL